LRSLRFVSCYRKERKACAKVRKEIPTQLANFAGIHLPGKAPLTIALAVALVICVQFSSTVFGQGKTSKPGNSQSQTYRQEGVAVEFRIDPIPAAKGKVSELLEGTEATVRFKVTDANAGKVLNNLRPAVWIDKRDAGAASTPQACREKVQSFLQSGFNRRPNIDLNSYFILTLNDEANISVIDPLSGFGGSKLYTIVALPGPGDDWVMSADRKRLYVSIPSLNQVAVVDIPSWKVVAKLNAGVGPSRLALQNDGKYLWVGNDAPNATESGVTVIDTVTLDVAARITTGLGHHEIAFTPDDASAFVTNKESGTVSLIDIRRLAHVKDIKVGSQPAALAFSPLSQTVYIVNEGDGAITGIDAKFETLVPIKTAPGSVALRVSPDGRFGFVVNHKTNSVYIFDLSTHRLIHEVPVGPNPRSDRVYHTVRLCTRGRQ